AFEGLSDDLSPKEQQRNHRQHARGGTARRSPSDRTLVSEWARKRKRTGNHIEHVRTDAGCRGEALTRWQTEYRRG
ncbi:hypothetical protein JZL91_23105, partial [Escherichia coli]|nr:hypothetical protein [Escherichia coli]